MAWTSLTGRPLAAAILAQSSNSGDAFTTRPSLLATLNRTGPSGQSEAAPDRTERICRVRVEPTQTACGEHDGPAPK